LKQPNGPTRSGRSDLHPAENFSFEHRMSAKRLEENEKQHRDVDQTRSDLKTSQMGAWPLISESSHCFAWMKIDRENLSRPMKKSGADSFNQG